MAPVIRNIQFAGIKDAYIRTFDPHYISLRGDGANWNFSPNSIQPMEFLGYTVGGDASGLQGKFIDYLTRYTLIQAGSITGFKEADSEYPNLCYNPRRERLEGWCWGSGTARKYAYLCTYYAPLDGGTHIYDRLGLILGGQWDNQANTGMPVPAQGNNWLTAAESYYSAAEQTLNAQWWQWSVSDHAIGGTGFVYADTIPNADFGSTDRRFAASLAFGGTNFVLVGDSTGGIVPYNAVNTDFASYFQPLQFEVQNPGATTIDFNTLFKQAGFQSFLSPGYAGWLGYNHDTITVNGQVLNGYGMIIDPAFTKYTLLKVTPMDTIAATWNNGITPSFDTKADRNGTHFLKRGDSGLLLFNVSFTPNAGAQPFKNLQQIPPVNLTVNPGLYR